MKKAMVFGTFDILHPGHRFLFKEAKKHGDSLVVVVALDSTVEKLKHKQPKHNQQYRLLQVAADTLVDKARLGYPDDFYKVIEEEQPDVICLGYDHPITEKDLKQKLQVLGLSTQVIRAKALKSEKYKGGKVKKNLLGEI